jgi:hypothetical protein
MHRKNEKYLNKHGLLHASFPSCGPKVTLLTPTGFVFTGPSYEHCVNYGSRRCSRTKMGAMSAS